MSHQIEYLNLLLENWWAVFAGLGISVLLEYLGIGAIRKKATNFVENNPPDEFICAQREKSKDITDEVIKRKWDDIIQPGDYDPSKKLKGGGFYLGLLERVFFYFAFLMWAPELIIGWLVFKVGSKWEVWQNIVKVPPTANEEPIVGLISRRMWGSRILQGFLVGTMGNIIAGLLGVFSTLVLIKFV